MAKKIKLNDQDNDFIGTNKDEKIFGNGGDDSISGAGGNDVVNGGEGNDTLKGGAGDDKVIGGNGDDLLLGGTGDDTLNGGAGINSVVGGDGDDTLVLAGNQADWTIGQNGDEWTFTHADGTVTTASGVEIVRFADGSVLVDDLDPTDPGEGETFTLTANPDDFVGGANNDTFQGAIANLGDFDNLEGGAGDDVLNLTAGAVAVAVSAAANVEGIETVNVSFSANGGNVVATGFEGATAFWQSTNSGAISGLVDGQTAGFLNTLVEAVDVVTYATGATAATVELDGVTTASSLMIAETTAGNLKSASVSGDVAGAGALTIDTGTNTTAVASLDLNLTSNGTVTLTVDAAVVTTVDASGSTGNLTINATAITALTSLMGGSGNDTFTASNAGLTAAALTVDLGAGNDVFGFNGTGNAAATATTVTLGAGNDTFRVDTALTNVTSTAAVAADLITIADFDPAADVLDLQALGARDVLNNTELANINAAATLDAALALVEAATTDGDFSIFEFGGDAYVFNDVAGVATFASGDGLLKLEDTLVTDFTGSNLLV